MALKEGIVNWDGKEATKILNLYEQHHKDKKFLPEIVSLLAKREHQMAASWLLKKYLERKNPIDSDTIFVIYSEILSVQDWEAKLHILQSIPYLPIPSIKKEIVEKFLRDCLVDKNKFVRAWAYGGFYLLADQFPEYQDEAKQFIDSAMINESASIKARIRNATKKGFLSTQSI